MKALFASVLVLVFSFSVYAADPLTLKVSGMTCGGCEKSIEVAVQKVPGVKSCSADHKTGKVTVVLHENTKVDQAAVAAAVKSAGDYQISSAGQ